MTFTTYERSPVFHDAESGQLFLAELRKLRIELGFLLLGYVVMPEHVHLVIVPGSGAGLSKVRQYVKGRFS
ncbi:MAG: transposase [Chloroflexi bacterium]|nr:transposase [Chloroflexota bacterium]